jgi:hypothetical protein
MPKSARISPSGCLPGRWAALAISLGDVLVISPTGCCGAHPSWCTDAPPADSGPERGPRCGAGGVVAGGADAIVVLPIDLPFVTAEAITQVLRPLDDDPGPLVVLVTDRHGTGTNVLALRPPGIIGFLFGPGSRAAHRDAAAVAGATYTEVDGPLAFDLDTPADLVLFEGMAPEGIGAG